MGIKVLILDGGARGSALGWKIGQSPLVDEVHYVPGNAGAPEGFCHPIDLGNKGAIVRLAQNIGADFVVVGPELPLINGIVDTLRNHGITAFGPMWAAAKLEGSKYFTRQLCSRLGIPAPRWSYGRTYEESLSMIEKRGAPIVVKADGLCLGKGVVVAETTSDASHAAHLFQVERVHDDAGRHIVFEEQLFGPELTVMFFCAGLQAILFGCARDRKRLLNENEGPNTGGMGSFSPVPDIDGELIEHIKARFVLPVLGGLMRRGIFFSGILNANLILTKDGPKLLEFNVRFGSPEVSCILPRVECDIVPYLLATAKVRLGSMPPLQMSNQAAVCKVLAAAGYPEEPVLGAEITGIDEAVADGAGKVHIFHGGTVRREGKLCVGGGRVLECVGLGETLEVANERAERAASLVHFEGKQSRTIYP